MEVKMSSEENMISDKLQLSMVCINEQANIGTLQSKLIMYQSRQ